MPRTTATLVSTILESPDADPTVFDPDIGMANELVTEVCAPLGYSDTRLEYIERLLAAHFYCIRNPQVTFFSAGTVQESYDSKVDLRLQVTKYGQQAMIMDTKGGLAGLNNSAGTVKSTIASVTWLGDDCT